MARLSKRCPACRSKQPVQVLFVPQGGEYEFRARCLTCGADIPPDGPKLRTREDIDAWVAEQRAKGVTP